MATEKKDLDLGEAWRAEEDVANSTTLRPYEGLTSKINEYCGYEPPPGVTVLNDRVDKSETSPPWFFADYVTQRRPVVIASTPTDAEWAGHLWTNRYLMEKAGNIKVLVEKQDEVMMRPIIDGCGIKSEVEYKEFLEEIERVQFKMDVYGTGHQGFDLVTPDLEQDDSDLDDYGMPQSFIVEPLKSLAGDFPICPSILGNLIPYKIALSQGSSHHGLISSQLHHDFHDSLHVLIRGRKRFRLFPPSAARWLDPVGRITKIHTNGLIVYEFKRDCNTVNVRSDGVPLAILARCKREDAEEQAADAEDALLRLDEDKGESKEDENGSINNEMKRLQKSLIDNDKRRAEAIEESIRYGDMTDDDEVISIPDSDDDEPAAKQPKREGTTAIAEAIKSNFCKIALPTANSIEELEIFLRNLSKTASEKSSAPVTTKSEGCKEIADDLLDRTAATVEKCRKRENENNNKNSEGSDKEGNDVGKEDWSGSSHLPGCLVFDLKPGEMLYIPASWFYDVTSQQEERQCATGGPKTNGAVGGVAKTMTSCGIVTDSTKLSQIENKSDASNINDTCGKERPGASSASEDGGHLAINYWMYPPNLNRFDRPYVGDFWERRWKEIRRSYQLQMRRRRNVNKDDDVINIDSEDSLDDDDDDKDERRSDCLTADELRAIYGSDVVGSKGGPSRHEEVRSEGTIIESNDKAIVRKPPIPDIDDKELETEILDDSKMGQNTNRPMEAHKAGVETAGDSMVLEETGTEPGLGNLPNETDTGTEIGRVNRATRSDDLNNDTFKLFSPPSEDNADGSQTVVS